MSSLIPPSTDQPTLIHADCLDALRLLPDSSVHVVVTDPPAAVHFMGRDWDRFDHYQPRTARGREVAARYGDDPMLAEVATFLDKIGEHVPETLSKEAEHIAAMLRDRYKSPLARMPAWSVGFVAFMTDVWSEVDRVLKPGGFVCAWALPKTADLAGLAGRAVGWDVHDSLLHLFGGGMPKGLNIGKALDKMAGAEREVVGRSRRHVSGKPEQRTRGLAGGPAFAESVGMGMWETAPATDDAQRWDGWNTQLAPGHEQWLLFRKPTRLTYAANVLEHCTGALHVDACRIPRGDGEHAKLVAWYDKYGSTDYAAGDVVRAEMGFTHSRVSAPNPGGSWPRNVVLTRGGDECPAEALDRQTGDRRSSGLHPTTYSNGRGYNGVGETQGPLYEDIGGASRFFTRFDDRVGYHPKAKKRDAGMRSDIANEHPTHKHVDLMRWLVRLMAATAETTGGEPAIVLDCFMGSGATGVACVAEGVRFIGIERDPTPDRPIGPDNLDSFGIARARILAAIGSPEAAAEANATAKPGEQMHLL